MSRTPRDFGLWEYELWADYGSGIEYVLTADSRSDAARLLGEYRANDGNGRGWRLRKVRRRVTA